MYYEMRSYKVKPGCIHQYLALFEEKGLHVISRYATLVGWWYTEIGDVNEIVHIWSYSSLDERDTKRKQLYQDPEWVNDFFPEAKEMLVEQNTKIMKPAVFSPIQ